MKNFARVLAAIIALLFLAFGARFMFLPAEIMSTAGLEATSTLGMATVRAFIGAGFLSFGILLAMHTVLHQQTGALRFTILFLLLSIVGRLLSLGIEGTSPEAIRNLIPVSLMLVVSVASLVLFRKSDAAA